MFLRFRMKTYKLIMNIFLYLVLPVVLAITVIRFCQTTNLHVPATPEAPVPTFMLPDNYVFRQDDPRWAGDRIDETEDRMAGYGCTISSVAMAASNLMGEEITAGDMQTRLSAHNGFTDRGWLIWSALPKATNGQIQARIYRQPDHTNIQSCMDKGHYPLIKIFLGGKIVHWVLIVGATETDYLVRDPLYGTATDAPVPLTSRADKIHALRCIEDVD